jgi:Domain of unknown function (DUF4170)
MAKQFWVVGGEYTDTQFTTIVPGERLHRLGPFASYPEAYRVWEAHARATIDDCHARFEIVESEPAHPSPVG